MNPFDNVGTTRICASFYDRLCRLAVGYQAVAEDEEIVALRTGSADGALVADAVALTRATRQHPDVRHGQQRARRHRHGGRRRDAGRDPRAGRRGRPRRRGARRGDWSRCRPASTLDETSDRTPEEVIREIWEDRFLLGARAARGAARAGAARPDMTAEPGAPAAGSRGWRPLRRTPKQLDEEPLRLPAVGRRRRAADRADGATAAGPSTR